MGQEAVISPVRSVAEDGLQRAAKGVAIVLVELAEVAVLSYPPHTGVPSWRYGLLAMPLVGSTLAAFALAVKEGLKRIPMNEGSRMLSYLPLAHSFERSWVEASSLLDGHTRIFFAEALDTFLQDLQRARPTMFMLNPPHRPRSLAMTMTAADFAGAGGAGRTAARTTAAKTTGMNGRVKRASLYLQNE